MLYSFQASFLFNHVARTGGVSMAEALGIAVPNLRTVGKQHAPLVEARSTLGPLFAETFKFAFVRNPWDRLVSWCAFLSTVRAGQDGDPAALADPDAPHWREFDGFLEAVARETVNIDGVTRPAFSQFHQLADANEELLTDRVGRFERLAADFSEISVAAGLRVPPLTRTNSAPRLDYRSYYSVAGRELIASVFARDVEVFGYCFGDSDAVGVTDRDAVVQAAG